MRPIVRLAMPNRATVAALRTRPDACSRLRTPARPGQRAAAPGRGRDDDPQGQHQLALPVPRPPTPRPGSSKAPSAPSARRGLRRPGLRPEQDRRHRRLQRRGSERLRADLQRYDIPVLYNFKDDDMRWVRIQPKAKMLVLDASSPKASTSRTTSLARISCICRRSSATFTPRPPAR